MSETIKPENNTQKAGTKDIYKHSEKKSPASSPAIPAATVVLLRDGENGVEVLMLRKNPKIRFGGMWVFPGGRIEEDDYPANKDFAVAARTAAARETKEETDIDTDAKSFIMFSEWTPPPITERRYKTSFFASRAPEKLDVTIDGGEIHEHQWINPSEALRLRDTREIDLVPPTWVTLHTLSLHQDTETLLRHLDSSPVRIYDTHVSQSKDGDRVVLWHGDAGYEAWDASIDGPRHRLTMKKGEFIYEDSVN